MSGSGGLDKDVINNVSSEPVDPLKIQVLVARISYSVRRDVGLMVAEGMCTPAVLGFDRGGTWRLWTEGKKTESKLIGMLSPSR